MKIKIASFLILSACCFSNAQAQQNTTASGGDASGSGGSVSYSVGQVDYIMQVGSGGTASQGVQQPYELLTTKGNEIKGVDLSLSVFPNPSPGSILLSVAANVNGITHADLYDASGKLLLTKNVSEPQTQIDIQNYASGIYFLWVYKNENSIKQFKIVKAAQ